MVVSAISATQNDARLAGQRGLGMVKVGAITCPKCGEDRETLITEVIDPMGKRWFCSVCAHEFKVTSSELSPKP